MNASTTAATAVDSLGNSVEPAFLDAPSAVTVPRWIALSGVSPAARAVAQELIDGTARVHGDQAPTLDRPYLAWVIGASRYDKVLPATLRELINLGFLVIYSGGTDNAGRQKRRRDGRTGQNLPDTYGLRFDPPDSYTGPRNRAEAYELFCRDRDDAYELNKTSSKPARAVSIPRKSFDRATEFPQVTPTPFIRGVGADPTPPARGTPRETPGQPHTPDEGCGHTPDEGCGCVSAGHAHTPSEGCLIDREMDGTPSGFHPSQSIDGTATEPSQAGPRSAPSEDTLATVRDLVRRLPWQAKGHHLTMANAERVTYAIASAMTRNQFGLDRAQNMALAKLSQCTKAGAAKFLIDGFNNDDQLLEPLAADDDVLPLPSAGTNRQQQADANTNLTKRHNQSAQPPPVRRAACHTCGAREGDTLSVRTIGGGHQSGSRKCPDCHPYAKTT